MKKWHVNRRSVDRTRARSRNPDANSKTSEEKADINKPISSARNIISERYQVSWFDRDLDVRLDIRYVHIKS